MTPPRLYLGCAGWNIRSEYAAAFPFDGSHLERYARTLPAVEINSSFYRPHQTKTYARWRASVPADFRFSVKVPKQITHVLKLEGAQTLLDRFLAETAGLEEKLGCYLVQLPPSLRFNAQATEEFFEMLRSASDTAVVLEPRHPSWTSASALEILERWKVGLVFADPNILGWSKPSSLGDIMYLRLHGSPVIYRSSYTDAYLDAVCKQLSTFLASGKTAWCILDNTADGASTQNALYLLSRLSRFAPVHAST